MSASPFGRFIVLPSEIRLLIWEELVKGGSLAILRTSQAIYHDIADRLYDTFDIHLTTLLEDPWIEIRCKRLCASWVIGRQDFLKFSDLARVPYDKVKLVVHIYAPDPDDCGQFILLWEKISRLTRMLCHADDSRNYNIYWRRLGYEPLRHCEPSPETFISMVIRLRKHNGVDWVNDGQVTSTFCTEGLGYDFNEVLLPFCRLSRVRRFRVIPDTEEMTEAADWGFVNYASAFIMSEGFVTSNDTFYSDDPEYRDIARTFDSIAGLVDGRDDFILALEAFHLPHISGRTAALMRREHYTLLLDMMVWRKTIPGKHYTR
ncbi:hypothetical protein AnigIFM50267_004737 [Aspergillus niger]|nr:hypothetical protein AnigIFM50267_004737 [Aspergillus niger]